MYEYTKIKKEVTAEKYFYWEPSRYPEFAE